MHELPIKPLSVNKAYRGRRFSTDEHKKFKDMASIRLKKMDLPKLKPKEKFYMIYIFFVSGTSDADNFIKTAQDSICAALGTDDRYVESLYCRKVKCKKGSEKIFFDIFTNEYDQLRSIQDMHPRYDPSPI